MIGKFRGNQILIFSYCTVSANLPRLYPGIRPHVDLRCKISMNLKSAHEITLETIELADLLLWFLKVSGHFEGGLSHSERPFEKSKTRFFFHPIPSLAHI